MLNRREFIQFTAAISASLFMKQANAAAQEAEAEWFMPDESEPHQRT